VSRNFNGYGGAMTWRSNVGGYVPSAAMFLVNNKNPGGLLAQRLNRGIRYVVILAKGCC
jgi:hypothetical protein